MIRGLIAAVVLAAAGAANAEPAAEPVFQDAPFDAAHWTFAGPEIEAAEILDQKALRLRAGVATLKIPEFATGIITYDVLMTDGPMFTGLRFHGADRTYEYFSLRPHRSGNPDSNQYAPVFNGDEGWQIYSGPAYSSQEGYVRNGWNHVEARIYPGAADIYINGHRSLRITDLKTGHASGFIALSSSQGARSVWDQIYYANFRYSVAPLVKPADMPAPTRFGPPGLVRHWQVTPAMSETDALALAGGRSAGAWSDLAVETNGIANLARVAARTDKLNATVARFEVTADKAGPRLMRLGYSDKVHVFVNGQLFYEGNSEFFARDVQFLGTVGFNDAVAAPLKRGRNEIAFVVTESYGGWAAAADFIDPAGLTGLGG